MNALQSLGAVGLGEELRSGLPAPVSLWVGAAAVFFAYCVGARLEFAPAAAATSISMLWHPNMFLMAAVLLWAALRFRPVGARTAFALIAFATVLGAMARRAPLDAGLPGESALLLQALLISVGALLLSLTAVITDRTRAVAQAAESEKRFTSIFDAIADAALIFRSGDGAVLDANQRWQELFGPAAAGFADTTPKPMNLQSARGDPEVVSSGRSEAVEMRTRDGSFVQIVWSTSSLRSGGDDCIVAIARDVTQQMRTEAELRAQRNEFMHVTRIANLSDFAGSLAHELTQPLTAILSNAQAARQMMAAKRVDYPEISEILDDIVEADKRAGEVIQRLRLLMKKSEPAFHRLSLNDVVSDTLVLARGEFLNRGIAVTCTLGRGLAPIYGDRVQLQQVLLNLFSNACEAMSEVPRWRRSLVVSTARSGDDSVCLAIADTGPGMNDDIPNRIFEPFFTTKEAGLGMGLSICRSIVAAHGGTIEVAHSSPQGVSFHVTLPCREANGRGGSRRDII